MDSVHKEREGILGLDELNETIAYSAVPEPSPERRVAVGEDVAVISVAARSDSLQAGVGDCLVVIPQPAPHVVPEDVRHVVPGRGRQAVVTDHTLELVAQLVLSQGSSILSSHHNTIKSPPQSHRNRKYEDT